MKRLLAAVETTAALFLLLVALVTAANVTLRGVFSVQIPDWFDGSKLLMGIALFWGIALATWHGSHIAVDVVWEHLAAAGRRRVDLAASLATLAFLTPLAWMVWTKVLTTGTQATSDLRLPVASFLAVAAVGAVVAALLALARLVAIARSQDADAATAVEADGVGNGS